MAGEECMRLVGVVATVCGQSFMFTSLDCWFGNRKDIWFKKNLCHDLIPRS